MIALTALSPEIKPHLPTQDELPSDDDIPMETQRHKTQMDLLIDVFYAWLEDQDQGYASGNMFIYFSADQVKNQDFRGPDFFAVVDTPKRERKSWVVWEEGKAPDVVIELLSESTATADKTTKKDIYQNQLRIPEYYWFDPFNIEDFVGFKLQNGIYQPIVPDATGGLLSERLGWVLTYWQGVYLGIDTTWIRWATRTGELLLTYGEKALQKANEAQLNAELAQQQAERAELKAVQSQQQAEQAELKAVQSQQQAEQAELKAVQSQQQAEQAIAQLQQTVHHLLRQGMTVAQVIQITGLSEEQIRAWQEP